jgi:hypothetical protein
MRNPFRYFNSSPEVIRLTVMLYIRYPLSLRQVENLLFERGRRESRQTNAPERMFRGVYRLVAGARFERCFPLVSARQLERTMSAGLC